MANEKPRDVESVLKDRMFLSMVLLDPRKAIQSFGIKADDDSIAALEKAAEGELAHWYEVVKETTAARANICNICYA
jgi:hypothetical protein